MNTVSRVIRNTGFLYMKMGITMFVSLYTTRLVLNALGVDDFGIFGMVAGVIGHAGFSQCQHGGGYPALHELRRRGGEPRETEDHL